MNKRQKKKQAKKAGTWEGGQYRGGRQEGRKNLVKTDTGVVNQHGVAFTLEEKKALEQAVNTANRKRARMLKQEAQLPRMVNGKETGDTVATLQMMGKESDFILQRKTKSLQRFKSKEDYNRYMRNLERVNKRDYITERVRQYKRNHIKAIRENLGDEGLAMKIRMMKPADYMRFVQSNEDVAEIHFLYGADQRQAKANQIRAALGMKIKDEDEIDDI